MTNASSALSSNSPETNPIEAGDINTEGSKELQRISSLINQETTRFNSTFQEKLKARIEEETQAENQQRIEEFKRTFDPFITLVLQETVDLAAEGHVPRLDEIYALKLEINTNTEELISKYHDVLTAGQAPTELTNEITSWQGRIQQQLDEFITVLVIAHFKSNLLNRTADSEVHEKIEILARELISISTNTTTGIGIRKVLQDIDQLLSLADERASGASIINKQIDCLVDTIKTKVESLPPELDREVQGELGRVVRILGATQVELSKNSNANQISKAKAIINYAEISIVSLTGKPNLVLAQKLHYASMSRLQDMRGGWHRWSFVPDQVFHHIKTPTKVMLGVIIAIPVSWIFINTLNTPPINGLLRSLPALDIPPPSASIATTTSGSNTNLSFNSTASNTSSINPNPNPALAASSAPGPAATTSASLPGTQAATSTGTAGGAETSPGAATEAKASVPAANGAQTLPAETYPFIILLVMTGTFGGVISILTRIQQFDNPKTQKYEDAFLPLLIGLIKPFLGGGFAFFIYLLLNSGISPIEIKGQSMSRNFYGFLALAFIAGFSERFVPDLISQVEKTYTSIPAIGNSMGLPPTTLSLLPATAQLQYEASQAFELQPPFPTNTYQISLNPESIRGKVLIKDQTGAGFVFVAPSQSDAAGIKLITITVASMTDPLQTASATVLLEG